MILSMYPNPNEVFCWLKKITMNPIEKDKSDVYELIFEIVRLVPKGRVTSYGAIAEALGMRSGARLVGYAMNLSHNVHPEVPAHRVVNSAGILTGKFHFGTPDKMQQLLEKEGVAVRNDKVVSFKELFWNPKTEL
jgi:methylated-DNA-protein-cysteine methyltransferase related protein